MSFNATVIADSISDEGIRLTTMQLRYPRFIHAELMTHRVFSRNASSSRAIPVAKMIEDIRRDPAMPIHWGSNKPGMKAGDEINEPVKLYAPFTGDIVALSPQHVWLYQMDLAITVAQAYAEAGYHKQIVNRMLEPWAHINVVVTSTEWANFFGLRSHPDAQPEIKVLSDMIQGEMLASVPSQLQDGQWHLPYVLGSDWVDIKKHAKANRVIRDELQYAELSALARKVSTARCARVSYLTHDGRKTSIEEDMDLHDKLVVSVPLHASPAEHQATPDKLGAGYTGEDWEHPELHGNLRGWKQYRKMLPGEFLPG